MDPFTLPARIYRYSAHAAVAVTVFLRSEAAATVHFAVRFVRLLFQGGVYFFRKPADISDGLIFKGIHISETVTIAKRCQWCAQPLNPAISHGKGSDIIIF